MSEASLGLDLALNVPVVAVKLFSLLVLLLLLELGKLLLLFALFFDIPVVLAMSLLVVMSLMFTVFAVDNVVTFEPSTFGVRGAEVVLIDFVLTLVAMVKVHLEALIESMSDHKVLSWVVIGLHFED